MSDWKFGFEPNIWGDPNDPPYMPVLSRSVDFADGGVGIVIMPFDQLVKEPVENWYEFLNSQWEAFVNEHNCI